MPRGVQSVRVSGVEDRVVEPFRQPATTRSLAPGGRLLPAFGTSSRPRARSRSWPVRQVRRGVQGRSGSWPSRDAGATWSRSRPGRCPRLVTSGRGSTRLRDARSSSRSGTRPGPAGDARISPTAGAGGCPSTAAARAGSDCAARRRSAGRGPLQVPFDDVVCGTSRIGPSGDRREEGPTPERPEVDIV